MLDALRELLPLVAFLYLVDAFVWVATGGRLFVRRAGHRYRSAGLGLRPAALLPTDRAHVVSDLPIVFGVDGAFLPRQADAAGAARWRRDGFRFVAYAGVEIAVEHRTVRFGGEAALKLPSPEHAAVLAARWRRIAALPTGAERRARIAAESALDTDAVAALAAEARRLPVAVWPLLALTFAALPAAVVVQPEPWRVTLLLALAGAAWLGAVLACSAWARRLRALGGSVPRGALWQLLYFPPSALHPAKPLLLDLFARCDPLATAAVLLSPADFAALARRELAGAELAAAEGEAGWREPWAERAARIRALLERLDLEAAPPLAAGDPAAAAVCPTCAGRYRAGVARCPDCEVELAVFGEGA